MAINGLHVTEAHNYSYYVNIISVSDMYFNILINIIIKYFLSIYSADDNFILEVVSRVS